MDALEAAPLRNVAALVSLSKTLGVPGLRLGYLYCQDGDLHTALRRRLPIWNTSAPAEYFVELLLKFRSELAASLERTVKDRQQLRTDLLCVAGVAQVGANGGNQQRAAQHQEVDGQAVGAKARTLNRNCAFR